MITSMLILSACSSTKITTVWASRNYTPGNYRKILVLGLIQQRDRTLRTRMEEHFVGDLTELGYKAVSSLDQYGPQMFSGMSEKEALEKIRTSGVDAVVTIALLDKKKERRYVPGQPVYQGNLWDYMGKRNTLVYEPGYYVTDTHYFWETNFYEMKDLSLLYSVQTKTFSPSSAESMGHEYGQMIVRDMLRKHILETKQVAEED